MDGVQGTAAGAVGTRQAAVAASGKVTAADAFFGPERQPGGLRG
jgi:hypothetical protein